MKEGYQGYPIKFLNEGGKMELIEKNKNGTQTNYTAEQVTLNIKGKLTITQPDKIKINDGILIYSSSQSTEITK